MADVQFGVDLSHHKPGFDFAWARRQGISFALLKASEGDSLTDPTFPDYLISARAAGLLTCAYHYQRADASVSAQLRRITSAVPRTVPVALDVERSSGSITVTRQLISALGAAGYRVPWLYLPRWYWQEIGSPSLTGLPPLWSARYPDMVVGSVAHEYGTTPASYWSGYGGLPVELLQFTSSAALANYGQGAIDVSAYRGPLTELAGRLRTTVPTVPAGNPAAPLTPNLSQEDDDMILAPAGTDEHVDVIVTGKSQLYVACSWGESVAVSHILFYGPTNADPAGNGVGGGYDKANNANKVWTFRPNRPGPVEIPKGAAMATIRYSAKHSFGVGTA